MILTPDKSRCLNRLAAIRLSLSGVRRFRQGVFFYVLLAGNLVRTFVMHNPLYKLKRSARNMGSKSGQDSAGQAPTQPWLYADSLLTYFQRRHTIASTGRNPGAFLTMSHQHGKSAGVTNNQIPGSAVSLHPGGQRCYWETSMSPLSLASTIPG